MVGSVCILGSTGSIGRQALEVCKEQGIKVFGLTANSNIELLEQQAREFAPKCVAVANVGLAKDLRYKLNDCDIEVLEGEAGLVGVASMPGVDMVVSAIVGVAGLKPTYAAIKSGHDIALANKETLVVAGEIIMDEARNKDVRIIPVDSEHSAIFQCLYGNDRRDVEKIILTASGGPFRGKTLEYLKNVTPKMALQHPNWVMGKKITIDSATMMNKGFEVMEAKWLFDIDVDDVEVVVHKESIVHSMVEYVDGVVMAQLGIPDMRIPISHALMYPDRVKNSFGKLNLIGQQLTFEKPDMDTFECLKMAYQVSHEGGLMPMVLNTSNEVAVDKFLKGEIGFLDIPDTIKRALDGYTNISNVTINDILERDKELRIKLGA